MFFDANNDGYITVDELERAMNKCGVYPSKLELRVIMSQGDVDSKFKKRFKSNMSRIIYFSENGVITFDEFVQLMRNQDSGRTKYNSQQLYEQFQLFDKDKDGFIEKNEMIEIVRELNLGRFFPISVIDQLFREADVDGDGRISFKGKSIKSRRITNRVNFRVHNGCQLSETHPEPIYSY